jgi:hypothetical protein
MNRLFIQTRKSHPQDFKQIVDSLLTTDTVGEKQLQSG